MMKFSKSLLATAATAGLLSACAPIPVMEIDKDKAATVSTAKAVVNEAPMWDELPVITEGSSSVVLITPMTPPEAIQDRKIASEWDSSVTVKDVVAMLSGMGISVIISEKEIEDKSFYLPRFRGTIGQMLAVVSRATNTWFTYEDGVIVASSKVKVGVTLPQEKEFSESLKKGLESIGVKDNAVSWEAGLVFAEVTPEQFPKAKLMLERLTANAAIVNLQVSVINVTLSQTAKQGIDWDGLTIAATKGGTMADVQAWQKQAGLTGSGGAQGTGSTTNGYNNNNNNNGNNNSNNSDGSSSGTGSNTNKEDTTPKGSTDVGVSALQFAGQALNGAIFTKRINIGAMFNFLKSYGDAQTDQNVVLKTVSGKKVEFNSLIQVPYVSEIGNTNTANSNSTSASSKTEKADDGIKVSMTPTYDAAANIVSVDIEMALKAVVAFNELSAGNQLGTMTQPTTATRDIVSSIRLRPGETAVLGGLTYNSVSDNRSGPTFLQKGSRLESQSLTVSRQTMYIVMRPTIVKMGALETQNNAVPSLQFMQPASK